MATTINDEFMQQIANEQAWKELSENFAWTETLLEKYCDKVDWEEISSNTNILWTIPMLQKFSKKVDWKRLSGQVYGSVEWFTEAHLEEFKDKWDWTLLSNNISLITENTIDKFIDYWDWDALIDGSHYFKDFDNAISFFNKYKDRIQMSKLQDTVLWQRIIEQTAEQIESEIMS